MFIHCQCTSPEHMCKAPQNLCLSSCGYEACKPVHLPSSDSTLDFPKLHNLQLLSYFRPLLMLFSQLAMFTIGEAWQGPTRKDAADSSSVPPWTELIMVKTSLVPYSPTAFASVFPAGGGQGLGLSQLYTRTWHNRVTTDTFRALTHLTCPI